MELHEGGNVSTPDGELSLPQRGQRAAAARLLMVRHGSHIVSEPDSSRIHPDCPHHGTGVDLQRVIPPPTVKIYHR